MRPRSRVFLSIILAGLSAFNLLGAVDAHRQARLLEALPLSVAPGYVWVSAAVWAVVWAALAVGVWRGAGRARRVVVPALGVYLAQGWLNRLAFGRSDYLPVTAPCAAAADLALLVLVGVLARPGAAPEPGRPSPKKEEL